MVAYGFKKQFIEPIRARIKKQTIRANGRRAHANDGDKIQLYTAMRTKHCEKIMDEDPECVGSHPVKIFVTANAITHIWVAGYEIKDLDDFAVRDGFENIEAMHQFWLESHGVGMFHGTLIEWGWR